MADQYTEAQLADGTKVQFKGDLNPDQLKQKVAEFRAKQQAQPTKADVYAPPPSRPPISLQGTEIKAPIAFSDSPVAWLQQRANSIEAGWESLAPGNPILHKAAELAGTVASSPARLAHGFLTPPKNVTLADPEEIRRGTVPVTPQDPRNVAQWGREVVGGATGLGLPFGLGYTAAEAGVGAVASSVAQLPLYEQGARFFQQSLKQAGVPDEYAGLLSDIGVLTVGFLHGKGKIEEAKGRTAVLQDRAAELASRVRAEHPDFDTYSDDVKRQTLQMALTRFWAEDAAAHSADTVAFAKYMGMNVPKAPDIPTDTPTEPPSRPSLPQVTDLADHIQNNGVDTLRAEKAATDLQAAANGDLPTTPEEQADAQQLIAKYTGEDRRIARGPSPTGAERRISGASQIERLADIVRTQKGPNQYSAVRLLREMEDHPVYGLEASRTLTDLQPYINESIGPQPTELKPGEELPRPLGAPIKSAMPARPEGVADIVEAQPTAEGQGAPKSAIITPPPAEPTKLPPLVERNLGRTGLLPPAQAAFTKAVVDWGLQLGDRRNEAVASLEDRAGLLGSEDIPNSVLGFLTRSVAQHNEVEAFKEAGTDLRHKTVGRTEEGKLLQKEGASQTMQEALSQRLGQRRAPVKVKGAKAPEGPTPEFVEKAKDQLAQLKEAVTAGSISPENLPIVDEKMRELESIIAEHEKAAFRTSGKPRMEQVGLATGIPPSQLENTGTGFATAPHSGLDPDMNEAIWVNYYNGKKHGGRPTLAQKQAKLAQLKLQRAQLKGIAEKLRKMEGQRGSISNRPKREAPKVEGGFYNHLEKTVFTKMPEQASASQIAGILRNSGVSRNELVGSSFDTFLQKAEAEGRSLTKSEVLDFINLNKLKLEETKLGGGVVKDEAKLAEALVLQAKITHTFEAIKAEIKNALKVSDARAGEYFHDLDMLGTRDYMLKSIGRDGNTEFTSATPEQYNRWKAAQEQWAKDIHTVRGLFRLGQGETLAPKYKTWTTPGGSNYQEVLVRAPSAGAPDQYGASFITPHGQTNIQDYHSPHFEEPNILFHIRANDRVSADGKKTLYLEEIQSDWAKDWRQWEKDRAEGRAAGSSIAEIGNTPKFPLEGTWHELALKYALKMAVEGGYDQIAWTTGEMQGNRYGLRKHIDSVNYVLQPNGTVYYTAYSKSEPTLVNRREPTKEQATQELGPEIAEAMFAGKGSIVGNNKDGTVTKALGGFSRIVGGEHHVALYDRMIPQFLNRYAKKWGAQVGISHFNFPAAGAHGAHQLVLVGQNQPAMSLPITTEMRQAIINEGQRMQGGFTTQDAAAITAGASVGAAIGGVVGGPIGAAVGAVAGAGLAALPWGGLASEVADLRARAGIAAADSRAVLNQWVTTVSANPLVSNPMFRAKGDIDRLANHARKMTEAYYDAGKRLTKEEAIAIWDSYKSGDISQLPDEWKDYATLRTLIDNTKWFAVNSAIRARADITGRDFSPVPFLDNHVRMNWKVPRAGSNAAQFLDKASHYFGSSSFMKPHTLPSTSAGLAAGLEPIDWNPVANDYRTWDNIDKYTEWLKLQTHFIESAQQPGGIGFEFARHPQPGFFPIKGPGMEVWFPAESGEGLVKGGQWYANDRSLMQMFKNATSTSTLGRNPIVRSFFAIAHPLSTWRLFGPYHLYAMTRNAFATGIGFGLRNLSEGFRHSDPAQIAKGVQDFLASPFGPFTLAKAGRDVQHLDYDFDNFVKTEAGKRMLAKYPNAEALIDLLWAGGGKNMFLTPEKMKLQISDKWMQNLANMQDAWAKKHGLTATGRASWAALTAPYMMAQLTMQPIFNWYIPMLKTGVALRDLSMRLEERRGDIADGRVTEEELARETVNMTEGFFGELNADNLFWNKTQTAALSAYYRSFTWRFGTATRLGAAAAGQAKEFARPANIPGAERSKGAPKLDPNMANWLGIVTVSVITGALYYWARKQKLPNPITEPSKYLSPESGFKDDRGKPLRFQWPDYSRDIQSIGHDPLGYATGGERDLLQRFSEAINNKQFDGSYVSDPHNDKLHDFMNRFGHAVIPYENWAPGMFFQQNVDRFLQQGLPKDLAWSLVAAGASPAPRWLNETPAETEALKLGSADLPQGPSAPEEIERAKAIKEITATMMNRQPSNTLIKDFIKRGVIQPSDIPNIFERLQTPYIVRLATRLDLEDNLSVLKKANPEERRLLIPIVVGKLDTLATIPDPKKRAQLQQELRVQLGGK